MGYYIYRLGALVHLLYSINRERTFEILCRVKARGGLAACGGGTAGGDSTGATPAEGVHGRREERLGVVGTRHCLVALHAHRGDDQVRERS